MPKFEQLAFKHLFNLDCLNDYDNRGRQIFFQRAILFNPCLSQKFDAALSSHRAFQKCGTFVVTAPRVFHGDFNSSGNIESAVNYADSSSLQWGSL